MLSPAWLDVCGDGASRAPSQALPALSVTNAAARLDLIGSTTQALCSRAWREPSGHPTLKSILRSISRCHAIGSDYTLIVLSRLML